MNTQANVMHETPDASQATVPAVIPVGQRLYWLVRRELWETRSIYIAPLAVAALILLGFLISAAKGLLMTDPMRHELMGQPYLFAEMLIMVTTFLVAVFYCLEALHGERSDRSILFWKSLPVSDLITVLSKAIIPIVVIPLLTFAITVVTQGIMLLIHIIALRGNSENIAGLWNHLSPLHMSLLLLYHLVATHALWYAPIYAWLLLVSAWARRAPLLWALLLPIAIAIVEKIAFNTSYFLSLLKYRFGGGPEDGTLTGANMSMNLPTFHSVGRFLVNPDLWLGLAVAAAFLAAAVQLRRYRELS
jgi:ABC-2 type transport system permease protein